VTKLFERISSALQEQGLPTWVQQFTLEPISDHDGEAALLVQVVVKPGQDAIFKDGEKMGEMLQKVHRAVHEAEADLWPYVRFVSAEDAEAA
jgi:hypothetical protein